MYDFGKSILLYGENISRSSRNLGNCPRIITVQVNNSAGLITGIVFYSLLLQYYLIRVDRDTVHKYFASILAFVRQLYFLSQE